MTQQTELWEGKFGDFYQERNTITEAEVINRYKLWEMLFKIIYTANGSVPKSVLEVGAGQGPNLMAIEKLSLQTQQPIKLFATEINQKARLHMQENVKTVELLTDIPKQETAELVYTYGVMIHVHPAHLLGLMKQMYAASSKYIVCCEYFAPDIRPLPYRGEKDALWLNDYGKMWMSNFGLRLVAYGFCWKPVTGLDNITHWVFEKRSTMI